MNRLIYSFSTVAFLFLLSAESIAQSAKWAIKPEYPFLDRFADNIYKVRSGNKVGLLNISGKLILPVSYDSITNFSKGYALALNYYNGKYQIKSIICESNYSVNHIQGEYYLGKYSSFSEEKLCVSNSKGLWGFLTPGGELAIECKYASVHPFCDEYASVTLKDKRVIYINDQGQIMQIEPGDGIIYFGSSFSNGEAVAYTIDRKGYVINKSGQTVRSYKVSVDQIKVDPINYCIYNGTPQSTDKPALSIKYDGPTTFVKNGLYGYKNGSIIVLPAQFSKAEPFSNGYAKVCLNDKYGILKLIDGTFSGSADKTSLNVNYNGEADKFNYIINIPSEWKGQKMDLNLIDKTTGSKENGLSNATGSCSSFSFTPVINDKTVKGDYDLTLSSDGLLLWTSMQSLSFNHGPTFTISGPFAVYPKADENDKFHIEAIIKNNTTSAKTITVSLSGGGIDYINKELTIEGKSSESISSTIPNVKSKEYRTVYLKTSIGNNYSKKIYVQPFY